MLHEHTSPCRHLFDTPILGQHYPEMGSEVGKQTPPCEGLAAATTPHHPVAHPMECPAAESVSLNATGLRGLGTSPSIVSGFWVPSEG